MLKVFVAFLGRFCISIIFIAAAIKNILNWDASNQLVATNLNDWLTYSISMPWLHDFLQSLVPMVGNLLILATSLELVGGLCVLLGLGVRFGAFLLFIYLIPTTLVMHHFWFVQQPDRDLQTLLFMKNVGILGGILLLLAFGRGFRSDKPSKTYEKPEKK